MILRTNNGKENKMENKIYLVEGLESDLDYETHRVFAVCLEKEKADEYLDYLNQHCQRGDYWVCERSVNVLYAPPEYRYDE